jgi:hypothetical protein
VSGYPNPGAGGGGPPSGPAGGDLGGTYPNPDVEAIDGVVLSGVPTAGQVLTATAAAAAHWAAAGGSSGISAIGRPKSSDGNTYYGIPFAPAFDGGWRSMSVGAPIGQLDYTPLPILAAISVTSVSIVVDTPAFDGGSNPIDSHARVALVAADQDWQPTGEPLIQEIVLVPASTPSGTVLEAALGAPVVVQPGMYLLAYETDNDPSWRPPMGVQVQPCAPIGSSLCFGVGGEMLLFTRVTHAYGTLAAPLPTWAAADAQPGQEDADGLNLPQMPFFFEWDPS